MNQGGFKKIILVIAVVILMSVVGYFVWMKINQPLSITILFPKEGDRWEAGKTYTIKWGSKGKIDRVSVSLYPYPQGKARISEIVPNTGSYAYTIAPDEPAASYDEINNKFKVYISDLNNLVNAESPPFSIVPPSTAQSETANWKTFQQESGLYTLKYPNNWDVMSVAGDSEGADSFGFKNNSGGIDSAVTVGYYNQLFNKGGKVQIIREESFVVSGISGKKQMVLSPVTNHQFDRVLVTRGFMTFSISLDNLQYTPQWNQILSTLKFTDETADWKIYRNTAYGFEMKYPSNWNLKNNALSFSTPNGYVATLGVESISPTTKDFTIDEMRKEYDRVNIGNSRAPKASEVLKDIFIGNEAGLEWAGIACEQGNPCYAKYEFYSNSTWKKGFKFYLVMPNLKDSDVNYSTLDPRPLFLDDVTTIRKALLTFKFVN